MSDVAQRLSVCSVKIIDSIPDFTDLEHNTTSGMRPCAPGKMAAGKKVVDTLTCSIVFPAEEV